MPFKNDFLVMGPRRACQAVDSVIRNEAGEVNLLTM